MRTTWSGVPDELRQAASPLIERYALVLPDWVRLLRVRYNDEDAENYAVVTSEPTYRRITLTLGIAWLSGDPEEREWLIAHELAHPHYARLEQAWEELMEDLPKRARASAARRFDAALEEAVSGLAHVFVGEKK